MKKQRKLCNCCKKKPRKFSQSSYCVRCGKRGIRYVFYKYLNFDMTIKDFKQLYKFLFEFPDMRVHQLIKYIKNYAYYHIEEDWTELYKKLKLEVNAYDSSSYKFYIYTYGRKIGEQKFKESQQFISYIHSKKYYIEKYGLDEGNKRWKEYCNSKKHTYENYKKWYGDKADDKWNEFLHLQKHNSTKKYLKSKWNDEYDRKSKERSSTSLEYYLKRGYSLEEAKALQSERQTTFSKDKCIKKHGEEKGLRIWKERQDKWQETLNSKSEYEKELINIKKGGLFHVLVEDFSKSEQEAYDIIRSIDLDEFDEYNFKIDRLTNKTYNFYIDEIDPERKRGRRGKEIHYDLDHKVSRLIGFVFNIPPEVMSCKYNLDVIQASANKSKNARCSLLIKNLYDLFYNNKTEILSTYERED